MKARSTAACGLVFLLVLAAAIGRISCANSDIDWWPMFHHDLLHSGNSTSKAPNTNNVLWQFTAGNWVCSSPAVVDGKVYVTAGDGKTHCLDAENGDHLWSTRIGVNLHSSPAFCDGRVYVGSDDGNLYCLDAETGDSIWAYDTGGTVDSSPAVWGGKAFIGSWSDKVFCLHAETGAFIWAYTAGDFIYSSPAVYQGKVYFGSGDYHVYCLDAETGGLVWSYKTGYGVWSSPAICDDKVYVGSGDAKVYCLDATSGDLIWSYRTGDDVHCCPAVADGRVYVGSWDGNVYCLDAASGALIWSHATGCQAWSSPAVAHGKVYIGTCEDRVCCLDAMDGHLIWDYETGRVVHSSPSVANGRLYVGSWDKNLYCFEDIPLPATIVDQNAPGPEHDGLTWDTAFLTIQEGVDAATPGGEVWVADGTYVENVVMGEGVAIYGGFLGAEPYGYETERGQRDFENNVTTVDGNQSGSCVVMAVDARVDGFTLANGSGTEEVLYRCGGGIYCNSLGETGIIASNTITGNGGGYGKTDRGGGIYCSGSSPTITNNIISGNTSWASSGDGGGVYCSGSSPTITNNIISGNTALGWGMMTGARGGGIHCSGSSPTITNNIISRNAAKGEASVIGYGYGGGVYCSGSSPAITNNTICGNSASAWGNEISTAYGGGVYCSGSLPTITNNIISGNAASAWYAHGGGICGSCILSHNDVWNNSPDDYYACEPGDGDISADPEFFDPDAGDFHLRPDSPCIDAGDNDAPELPEYDFEGDPRILDGDGDGDPVVDMGADESRYVALPAIAVDQNAPGPGHDGTSWMTAFLTIQEGVDAATPNGEVWVADGLYVENVVTGEGVAIYGGFLGAEEGGYENSRDQRDFENNVTTIDGDQSGSCVVMAVGATVDGFTATNGSGHYEGGLYGGGFYCAGLGNTGTIANSIITGNDVDGNGGGICCKDGSSPTITDNTITGNWAGSGSGIYCTSNSSPAITNNTISGNSGPGGGIYCASSSPTITGNIISGHYAAIGAGVYCSGSSAVVCGNRIAGNTADWSGGGIYCSNSSPIVTNNTIAGNDAMGGYGGGMCCNSSSPLIADNTIEGNFSEEGGGGIHCSNSSAVIVNNDIVNGGAFFAGGGVCFESDSSGALINNRILWNLAGYGGGICCNNSSPAVTNNNIAYNTGMGYGGGICCLSGSSPGIANNIVYRNVVGYGGLDGRSALRAGIGDTVRRGPGDWGGGIWCSGDSSPLLLHNDFWENSPDNYSGCEPGEGDISADPVFLDPDAGNYHLSFYSPCVDAGTNRAPGLPEVDWEDEARVYDGDGDQEEPGVYATADIGADEFVPLLAVAPDPQPECDGALFGSPRTGYPGWAWFSIPVDPDGCCGGGNCYDPERLLGFSCSGYLWRWDKYAKTAEVYQRPFAEWDLAVGEGYLLFLWTDVSDPWYWGINPYCPWEFEFKLGSQGWTWVGLPGLAELDGCDFMAFVKVKYPSNWSGKYRTAKEDLDATPDNWVSWGWPYWNTWAQAPETFTPYAPFGHNTCYPWVGYRCWIQVGDALDENDPDQVTLIWP